MSKLPFNEKHLLAGLMVITSFALLVFFPAIGGAKQILTIALMVVGTIAIIAVWFYWMVKTFTSSLIAATIAILPPIMIVILLVVLIATLCAS